MAWTKHLNVCKLKLCGRIFCLLSFMRFSGLILQVPATKIAEFANSVDLDEVAHNEPPHLDLHCLPSGL